MVECLTPDRGAAGSSHTSVRVLCPWAGHINPSLVLAQPRKTHLFITERLLMGRKESNQTNKKQTAIPSLDNNVRPKKNRCVYGLPTDPVL